MAYRYDHDLEFLGELDNNRLENLVEILTKDKDGSARMTETLTVSKEYKEHSYNYSRYWKRIAEEIQLFGGNSFANLWRASDGITSALKNILKDKRRGVKYEEILKDVCDKMKVSYNKNTSTENIEQCLLNKILEDSLEKMSEEERQKLIKELNLPTTSFGKQAVTAMLQIQAIPIYVMMIRGLPTIVMRCCFPIIIIPTPLAIFSGPIGLTLTGLWTAYDIAGPAYRVTIPICIYIACLRRIHQYENQNKQ